MFEERRYLYRRLFGDTELFIELRVVCTLWWSREITFIMGIGAQPFLIVFGDVEENISRVRYLS